MKTEINPSPEVAAADDSGVLNDEVVGMDSEERQLDARLMISEE